MRELPYQLQETCQLCAVVLVERVYLAMPQPIVDANRIESKAVCALPVPTNANAMKNNRSNFFIRIVCLLKVIKVQKSTYRNVKINLMDVEFYGKLLNYR